MEFRLHNYATRPVLLRSAIEAEKAWIEARLRAPLAETVIIETRHRLAQIGVERILGLEEDQVSSPRSVRRLRSFVHSAEIPSGQPPLLGFSKESPTPSYSALFQESEKEKLGRVEWQDCPVALTLHSLPYPIVAMNLYYQAGPNSDCESATSVLIARRDSIEPVVRLLKALDSRETTPTLTIGQGRPRKIAACGWEDLVLDPSIVSLLRNDFESFWERESWFRERHLPFRRGYLLHGPPGNGKSTAVRAMMFSRGLSAFTMRLFEPQTSDIDLDNLFEAALAERPAMILFEDLDRAFPRHGESRTQVSLQHMLNSLDGVATGEGLIIVATANEPAALDPAILRRPGRFDRVVRFPNPSRELRQKYFLSMNLNVAPAALDQAVIDSGGFSFAQLREATILAAQFAFERKQDVCSDDLLQGVHLLRETMTHGSLYSNAAGFTAVAQDGEAA